MLKMFVLSILYVLFVCLNFNGMQMYCFFCGHAMFIFHIWINIHIHPGVKTLPIAIGTTISVVPLALIKAQMQVPSGRPIS